MKPTTPQVRGNICTDPDRPLYPPMEVGSEIWLGWLREFNVTSFHYESDSGKFTARKEERPSSTNEYWYAYRKIKGKLRKVYLGVTDELSGDRLEQVAVEISQSGEDYYYSRKGYTTRKQQSCVTNGESNGKSLDPESKGYPTKGLQNCVTTSSEVEALKTEVERLRAELLKTSEKYEAIQSEQRQLDNKIGELADKARRQEKSYQKKSFTQGYNDLIALAESRGV